VPPSHEEPVTDADEGLTTPDETALTNETTSRGAMDRGVTGDLRRGYLGDGIERQPRRRSTHGDP